MIIKMIWLNITRFTDDTQNWNFVRIFYLSKKLPPCMATDRIGKTKFHTDLLQTKGEMSSLTSEFLQGNVWRGLLRGSLIACKPYISFSPFHFLFSAFSPSCRPHISISLQQILAKVRRFINFYMINRAKAVFLGVYAQDLNNRWNR